MSLNIKNKETVELVRQLSRKTGTTMTGAVTLAVKAQLEKEKPRSRAGLTKWLNELTKETAAMMNDGRSSTELIEELYDPETGLPK